MKIIPRTNAAIRAIAALAEAIRGLGSVPSGHLYAQVIGVMDLDTYQAMLGTLVRSGLIEVRSDVVRWIGPTIANAETMNANGEEFVECARCHAETLESNTAMVGVLGDVRACRDCAKEGA